MDECCSICLGTVRQTRTSKKLICGHVFHGCCLSKWTETHPTCPNCRKRTDGLKYTMVVTITRHDDGMVSHNEVDDPSITNYFIEQVGLDTEPFNHVDITFETNNLPPILTDLGIDVDTLIFNTE